MTIETKRLFLRNFTAEDIDDVFEYCSQKGIGEMAGWPAHASKDDTATALVNWIQNKDRFAIVLAENGKLIGHIAVEEDSDEGRQDTRELGCALNSVYQRRGLMREAVRAVMAEVFRRDISYLWACCFQENVASKRMIESCGFIAQREGTFYSKNLNKTFRSYEYRLSREEWTGQIK